jgi:hypothetical protein
MAHLIKIIFKKDFGCKDQDERASKLFLSNILLPQQQVTAEGGKGDDVVLNLLFDFCIS